MNDFYKSIGFENISTDKRKLNKIIRNASAEPDFIREQKQDSKGRTFFERCKYLGDGFGLSVYGYRKIKTDKDGGKVEKYIIKDWSIFAEADTDLEVTDFFSDYGIDDWRYGFAEEAESGNLFEFRMNNILECDDFYKNLITREDIADAEKAVTTVNAAMLAAFGTIVLPVVRDDYTEKVRDEEDRIQKELLERARSGDASAEDTLSERAEEMEQSVRERLKSEDLLSIFEGYFLNLFEQSGIFSVLADIETVSYTENSVTHERVAKLNINITGTKMTVYINEKDILGMPMEGMRFMGVGILQGTVNFPVKAEKNNKR